MTTRSTAQLAGRVCLALVGIGWPLASLLVSFLFFPSRFEDGTYYQGIDPLTDSEARRLQLELVLLVVGSSVVGALHFPIALRWSRPRWHIAGLVAGTIYCLCTVLLVGVSFFAPAVVFPWVFISAAVGGLLMGPELLAVLQRPRGAGTDATPHRTLDHSAFWFPVVLALGLSGAGAVGAVWYARVVVSRVKPSLSPVFIAVRDIEPGSQFELSLVKVGQIPEQMKVASMLSPLDGEVLGATMAVRHIAAGSWILRTDLQSAPRRYCVASRDLKRGQVLSADDFEVLGFPVPHDIPPNAWIQATEVYALIGRKLQIDMRKTDPFLNASIDLPNRSDAPAPLEQGEEHPE
jgi:SAF domain